MALDVRVLGKRGADNAVLVTVDTGQHISRVLMDCGERIIPRLSYAETESVQHLLFSHYHMDHVAGFDSYFRRHYDRSSVVNHIWGPPGTGEIMGHRFRGYVWNLIGKRHATWLCHDIHPQQVSTRRYELNEAFSQSHTEADTEVTPLFHGTGFHVEAIALHHGIPSMGYILREEEKVNVDSEKLAALGLRPGAWLRELATAETCVIEGVEHDAAPLREALLMKRAGDSMAYLTDFIAEDPAEQQRIAEQIAGVGTLICECQYSAADAELARKNRHMTTQWVGQLAALAQPQRLLLTHFSERYAPQVWEEMVEEVRTHFPHTEAATH
jgi:ribonuclease Z